MPCLLLILQDVSKLHKCSCSKPWRCSTTIHLAAVDITANPAVTSIAILGVLALALSPYVLVIGSVVLLFSAASLPGPLKKLLPAPVVEVGHPASCSRTQVVGQDCTAAFYTCLSFPCS